MIEVELQMTPHVCHCVKSWLVKDCVCAGLPSEFTAQIAVVDWAVVLPSVSLKSISGGHPLTGHNNSTCVGPGAVWRERTKYAPNVCWTPH
jgi:hypothetical protein